MVYELPNKDHGRCRSYAALIKETDLNCGGIFGIRKQVSVDMVIMKVLPPDRLHVFEDAKCADRFLWDGWCVGRRRMMASENAINIAFCRIIPLTRNAIFVIVIIEQ